MNRWTGTGHLTRNEHLVTTSGGADICRIRIAVKRAARDGAAGYVEVKTFEGQAGACAEYLSAGREAARPRSVRSPIVSCRASSGVSVRFLRYRYREGMPSEALDYVGRRLFLPSRCRAWWIGASDGWDERY
jgi:Single-strand binding protein family